MTRRRRRSAAAIAAALALALVPAAAATGSHSHRVTIIHMNYSPTRVVISRGDSVTWVWDDGRTAHDVWSSSFRSSPVKTSGTWTVRFNRRGTYSYTCTIHPWMTGTVVVR